LPNGLAEPFLKRWYFWATHSQLEPVIQAARSVKRHWNGIFSWDTGAMRGQEKIFEVRRLYNDVTFIDEFLTPEFVRRHGLFTWEYDERNKVYVISDRDFQAVKEKLLFMLTNFGQPTIELVDANYLNRGELLLVHRYEGVPLKMDEAVETLENLHALWKRPVNLETYVDDSPVALTFDGSQHRREAALVGRS